MVRQVLLLTSFSRWGQLRHLAVYKEPQLLWHSSQSGICPLHWIWAASVITRVGERKGVDLCSLWAQARRADSFHLPPLGTLALEGQVGSRPVRYQRREYMKRGKGCSWAQPISYPFPGTRYGSKAIWSWRTAQQSPAWIADPCTWDQIK